MPDNSRIEDLRKRYHENPRRFFAPLANEYRKAGLLDRALLLCQKHVAEQPENMNGLVVCGQTLFEMQQPEAARAPFEQALQLDPENLIALRHLGDIARHLGDTDAAKGWYERVLELDRRNDEVIELLAQLGGADSAADDAAPAPRPSVTAGGLVSVAPTVSVSGGADFGLVELDAPSKPLVGKGGTAVIDAQTLANRARADALAPAAPSAATPAAPPAADPSSVPTVEIPQVRPSKRASLLDISFDFGEPAEAAEYGFAAEAVVDSAAAETLGLEPTIADPAPLPDAAAPAGDFGLAEFEPDSVSVILPSIHPLADLDRPNVTLEDDSITGASASATVPAPEATTVPTPQPAAAPPMSAPPEPAARASKATPTFVTETMAALYVKQGLFDNAIDVYRQLVAASPGDAGLRAKLSELERMQGQGTSAANAAADEMPDFDTPLDAGEPLPAPANAAMDGVSFGDFGLRGQGAATPIVTPTVPAGPTAREFFGGFARRAAVVADEAPAVGSGWPLDAIFGAANDVRDLHAAATLAGVGTFTGPDGGTGIGELLSSESAPGDDDLDQFQDWLKGLKQ